MGRAPRNPWKVARRCPCGKPQVIQTGPVLEDGTPFPTLWWLSCKTLVAAVGRLESGGLMQRVNRLLAEDAALRRKLESSTARFLERRDGCCAEGPLRHPGGGPQRVKCLHAHLAHHLVTGDNPVGEMVWEALSGADPDIAVTVRHPCV